MYICQPCLIILFLLLLAFLVIWLHSWLWTWFHSLVIWAHDITSFFNSSVPIMLSQKVGTTLAALQACWPIITHDPFCVIRFLITAHTSARDWHKLADIILNKVQFFWAAANMVINAVSIFTAVKVVRMWLDLSSSSFCSCAVASKNTPRDAATHVWTFGKSRSTGASTPDFFRVDDHRGEFYDISKTTCRRLEMS